ncbi:sodium/hydrogen exchanger 7-like isoform X2 [Salvia splendens]|uniref:sodium/hydrogen exchanger 7-like isoform X2 n=1 Tax=Salvia splendens TaxID=180675 RepID=UPI001C26EA33|nr:sodium/hydrogen exchanger 7-like isoform X2 [Salvia splendens]
MQYFGYGLDWREAIVLFWSGLRGAVALALSLSVKRSSDNSPYISPDTGDLFVFLTGGIVFLTLIVNGSTTQFILHFLKMDNLSPAKKRILNYTKYEMLKKALESFGDLRDDEELGPADWTTVRRYIKSLNDADGEQIHPHSLSENNNILDSMNLKDIRVRFLNGVQAAYWIMLDEGRINQTTANLLMRSVEKIGLLEKKEMIHLPDAVQTDLKKFLRNPPLVKTPKIKDLISANPLLGALPATAREALAGSTKEIMRLSETTLYKEGSKATGIWLLSNGVVKFLHPTFTHGSTLGLYEVLAEKPYTCDIVTNSVVMCFFIETEKILSVLRSDPAVEDFFWKVLLFTLKSCFLVCLRKCQCKTCKCLLLKDQY